MPTLQVYVDSNILIEAGKPPGGPLIDTLESLVKAEMLTVLTTDLSISEIVKKHTSNDYDNLKGLTKSNFRTLAQQYLNLEVPEISIEQLKSQLRAHYDSAVKSMFQRLNAQVIGIDSVKPSSVFDQYSHSECFFSEGKKNQFPDAFIFECLKPHSINSSVTIVSKDSDFEHPVELFENFSLVKSIAALLEELGLRDSSPPDLPTFLASQVQHVNDLVQHELQDWGLWIADVEDAEADDVMVEEVNFNNLASFVGLDGGDSLLVGDINVKATVDFSHPNWADAMWDSEDKRLIPFETVTGESEVELDVGFSAFIEVDESGTPTEITSFQLRSSQPLFVEIYEGEVY